MLGSLKIGHTFETEPFGQVKVVKLLGSGGQGEVFQIETDQGDRALKWYFPSMATAQQRAALKQVVASDLQEPRLLWPEAFIENSESFGYIMKLRPPEFVTLSRIVKGRVDAELVVLIRAAIGLVRAFRSIQTAGLAYRDIKDPNVFVNPGTGDVLVCDNDNAVADSTDSQIKGTTDFCAPEILVDGARPSSTTDRHSLAVLLFMLLVRGHPLDGKRERAIKNLNEAARRQLYGEDPLFVFDIDNDENAPVEGVHDRVIRHYSIWPEDLRDLWQLAFGPGLRAPQERPTLQQWLGTLLRVHDSIRTCPACGLSTISPESSATAWSCWNCTAQVSAGPRCRIHDRTILLSPGVSIFQHHLTDSSATTDFDHPAFTTTEHPSNPGVFGIRNDGSESVTYLRPGKQMAQVEPGKNALVVDGAELSTSTTTLRLRT